MQIFAKLGWVVMLLVVLSGLAAGQETIWVEAENPATKPSEDIGYQISAWTRSHFLSGGQVLAMNINPQSQDKIPESGMVFTYKFNVNETGQYNAWIRIGYEFARSDFDWRIDNGEWKTITTDDTTIDPVSLGVWNEIGWLNVGKVQLDDGAHTLSFRHFKAFKTDNKGNKKPTRILHMLDAMCFTQGEFKPNNKFKPGEDYKSEEDKKAAETVFKMPATKAGERGKLELTGLWEIARWDEYFPDPDTLREGVTELPDMDSLYWYGIQTPGFREQVKPLFDFCHRMIYRTRVDVPAEMEGRGWVLEFQQFNLIASVFVNGQFCDWSKQHDAVWQCDLTKAMKAGQSNEVVVVLKDMYYALDPAMDKNAGDLGWRKYYTIPRNMFINSGTGGKLQMTVSAPHGDGGKSGLLEPITLISTGKVWVEDVFAKPSVSQNKLDIEVTLANASGADATVTVENRLIPWSAEGIDTSKIEKEFIPAQVQLGRGATQMKELSAAWDNPKLWWPDDPNLYIIETRILQDGKLIDTKHTRFGFREWGWQDGVLFTLNGKPWQFWQDTAGFSTPQDYVKDSKVSGRNSYRFWGRKNWGGMTRREILNYFDETGMVVRDSSAFDGEVANYGVALTTMDKKNFNPILMGNVMMQQKAWVRGSRNHPCILIWSLENEVTYVNAQNLGQGPQFEPAIRLVADEIMQLDPTRPVMVDGGNALMPPENWKGDGPEVEKAKQLGHLPVNGGHYMERSGASFRDYPDAAYTAEHWYTTLQRGAWPTIRDIPIFHGEIFYGRGNAPAKLAVIGGEMAFTGDIGTYPARGMIMRMLTEGYRYGECSSGWDLYTSVATPEYYPGWQPVAILCREWNWTFGSGSTIERSLKIFNQTSSTDPLEAGWKLVVDGKTIDESKQNFKLDIGGREEFKIQFTVPETDKRLDGELVLTAKRNGKTVFETSHPMHVIVTKNDKAVQPANGMDIFVLDPEGSVKQRLNERGVDFKEVGSVEQLPMEANVIIVGRDAVTAESATDTIWQRLALAGSRILVFEQSEPIHYQGLPADFDITDYEGRIAFPQNLEHPIFKGLGEKDFFCWSGDHTLYTKAYKKATRGAVSLVQCDYNLDYTVLSECTVGDGLIVLSQLKVISKEESDPVASRLLDNMVDYVCTYEPLRRMTTVVMPDEAPELKLLQDMELSFDKTDGPLAALDGKGEIVVVKATPENLAVLAEAKDKTRAFAEKGGWIVFWNVTPEGLDSFNKIVEVDHLMRPFTREHAVLSMPRDPLATGITLRDVVMTTGKKIDWWKGTEWRSDDAWTYVVDYKDVAPFATINGAQPSSTGTTMPHPRNAVNGLNGEEFWRYLYYLEAEKNDKPVVTLDLPRKETVKELGIMFDTGYNVVTELEIYFDDDPEPLTFDVAPDGSMQSFSFNPRETSKITVKFSKAIQTKEKEVYGVGHMTLKVERSDDFSEKVKPIMGIGTLVKYPVGKGGFVLNELNIKPVEANPVNAVKKAAIAKGILSNLGAVFAGTKPVILGSGLNFEPVVADDDKYTAFMKKDEEPRWLQHRDRKYRNLDFGAFPKGKQRMAGVQYEIFDFMTSHVPIVLMLKGEGSSVKAKAIKGIEFNKKADALFFLHTYNPGRAVDQWEKKDPDKRGSLPSLFSYVVHYENGKTETVDIHWNQEVGSWVHDTLPEDLPGAALAWSAAGEGDDMVYMAAYSMQWNNPMPDVAITSIDIQQTDAPKADDLGAAAVLGITAATTPE